MIVGSQHTISAPTPQLFDGEELDFLNWSDGGAATHTVTAGPANETAAGAVSLSRLSCRLTGTAPMAMPSEPTTSNRPRPRNSRAFKGFSSRARRQGRANFPLT